MSELPQHKNPTSLREALIIQALGDIDDLLKRVEALPDLINASTEKLNTAESSFITGIIKFTESAKSDLTEYVERKGLQAGEATAREIRSGLIEAATSAVKTEAFQRAEKHAMLLAHASKLASVKSSSKPLQIFCIALSGGIVGGAITLLAIYLLPTFARFN